MIPNYLKAMAEELGNVLKCPVDRTGRRVIPLGALSSTVAGEAVALAQAVTDDRMFFAMLLKKAGLHFEALIEEDVKPHFKDLQKLLHPGPYEVFRLKEASYSGCAHILGYSGFYVDFYFTKDGTFAGMGVWE